MVDVCRAARQHRTELGRQNLFLGSLKLDEQPPKWRNKEKWFLCYEPTKMETRTESFANKLLYSICFASRTTLCYRDICSLSTLQEMEENPPPDFQLPCFSSWTTSQSVQANIPTSAPLAPRNGHEQPYWYRPHYIGWQYVTSGTFYIAHEVEYIKKKKSL